MARVLYRVDSALCSLGAPRSPLLLQARHVKRSFPLVCFEPISHLSPQSSAWKDSIASGPANKQSPCRRGTRLPLTRPDRFGGKTNPLPRSHCSGSLPNPAEEGEADTSGRHMSPRSRDGLLGCTGNAGRTARGNRRPREGLVQHAGSGTSMAEGRNWLFFAELDATRRPEGTRRSRPGRGPGPAGSEATPGELPALEWRGERPRGNRGASAVGIARGQG